MTNTIRSFRFKMVLFLGLSMLISGVLSFMLYKILQLYYLSVKFEYPRLTRMRYFMREIGDFNCFLLVFIPLSLLLFFLLTRRYTAYFRVISNGIKQLAKGDFNSRIEIPSKDELGDLARDVNLASAKLEQALERGDFAENSKEQAILNLINDLRTPLTSAMSHLDLILQDEQMSGAQMRHHAGNAMTKSQRLDKLIDELDEIMRLTYGKVIIDEKTVDLSELLIRSNEQLSLLFQKNRLKMRMNVTPHVMVQGDGELLARVFENVLTNAARYGKKGVFIDIHCGIDASDAVVQVVTYGDGIPPEELPHIFDISYNRDKAQPDSEEDTGLGLYIAKNIVTQHQGAIAAQSNVIRTLIEVRLPLTDAPEAPH
ncbi:HAMP domain-containing histidine kinase [Paenibacillus thiaminolyticus]|uniref:HAMP domain-containing sensor histidine kinase n=1 Tax=Paenibacillus thiaminolyticus TaxID=49283 RepID=UPI00232FED18|nr:HAMP domain-containing sensor histidine kinase [Paenibacillus thiaminolyticus]WCF09885.1 HAMP domain-containing histidine kinase [Paenibacillus thiaminolyticus]